MTRVLICGGRGYNDWQRVQDVMLRVSYDYSPISCIIHGACCDEEGNLIGADKLAERWAIRHEYPYFGIPAKWSTEGKAAGPIRNKRMRDKGEPHLVVAFPGGRGTRSMVNIANAAGIKVIEVNQTE